MTLLRNTGATTDDALKVTVYFFFLASLRISSRSTLYLVFHIGSENTLE